MTPRDAAGKLLKEANLLVIDEVSMGHKYIFEAIDRKLQDIVENTSILVASPCSLLETSGKYFQLSDMVLGLKLSKHRSSHHICGDIQLY
ncbi:hypothetical protein ElyMa_007043900 [Elysia marginata]|uniref:ATP-dependent DNA helicase n=1 Tax=Elysia marginata TaxID=1093978 RepID=A0AAV4JVL8_9GAST|nr:hypothetical protein ElyMa_007043900 [Elysia marginata]